MFQPIVAPKPTNNKLVVPTIASPLTIDEHGKENIHSSSNIHLTYDYNSKDFVHTISQGIKTNKVSDADLLSISLISSAKKRKIYGNESSSSSSVNIASSQSAFSRPSPFDFRKGGSLHDTEEDEIEQNHLIDSIVQNATTSSSSMPTSPVLDQIIDSQNSNSSNNDHTLSYQHDHQDMQTDEPTTSNDYEYHPDNTDDDNVGDNDGGDNMDEGLESSSEDWARLRLKVGQAVMYQLLHVLNHGSIDEVTRLY